MEQNNTPERQDGAERVRIATRTDGTRRCLDAGRRRRRARFAGHAPGLYGKTAHTDISLACPHTGVKAIDDDIRATIATKAKAFRSFARGDYRPGDSAYTDDADYRIARNDGPIFAVVWSEEADFHGAHPANEIFTANYLLPDGWRVYLPEIVDGGRGFQRISALAIASLDTELSGPEGMSRHPFRGHHAAARPALYRVSGLPARGLCGGTADRGHPACEAGLRAAAERAGAAGVFSLFAGRRSRSRPSGRGDLFPANRLVEGRQHRGQGGRAEGRPTDMAQVPRYGLRRFKRSCGGVLPYDAHPKPPGCAGAHDAVRRPKALLEMPASPCHKVRPLWMRA
jgi:hypothetical protein